MISHAWNGYLKYAKGKDELKSELKHGVNWYGNYTLLLTPIDAFDTFVIMDMKKEAQQAKEMILEQLVFDLPIQISLFETTIRVLGGLLSAYEFDGDNRFLDKAVDLANRLLKSFETPSGLPVDALWLVTGKIKSDQRGMLSQVGSLQLEFQYLSDVTKDPKYANAALKVLDTLYFMDRPIKGLYPIYFDIDKAKNTCLFY